jgi:16S rRNA G966 N2-methylase RsmD
VDLSSDCCAATERNIDWCGFGEDPGKTKVVCADALQALRDPASVGIDTLTPFQIVTLCPPYEEIIYADLLDAVANSPVVGDDCIILVEYPVELNTLPHVIDGKDGGKLIGIRNRRYGRTVIAMYIANPTGSVESADSRPEEFVSVNF